MNKLLMLNASEHEIPFILAARRLGFYVVTTSTMSHFAGHRYADEYISANYNDYDEIIALCKREGITAISHGCTDDCALSAAYVGQALGLKGHDTFENAKIIHRKDDFKAFCEKHNVISPISKSFLNAEAALSAELPAFPLIIKPTDLAGGQGISVANNSEEYAASVKAAFDRSKAGHIVVEPFIKGTLHSLNTFIVGCKVRACCTANDYSYTSKYMTNSGIAPADNWQKAIEILIPETERIASILGLVDGQLHMQYIMDEAGRPWIIEMMRRNIGNNWSMMLGDSIGVNWPEWVIRAEAGMNCSGIPGTRLAQGYYGYHMVLAPRNGVFKSIEILEEFKPFVYNYTQWEQPGFVITNSSAQKLANVMFHFDTAEQKDRLMPAINQLVKVTVE